MSVPMAIVLVAGIVILVARRFRGVPLTAGDLFGPPAVMVAIGLWSLRELHLTPRDTGWLIAASVIGLVFGALRGTTPALFVRDGVLWQRYRISTLLVWALAMGTNLGVGWLGAMLGAHPDTRPMSLSIGIGLLGEMLTLGMRALSTGLPFAPDRRGSSESTVDRAVASLRASRPVEPPPGLRLDRSPTLRDGLQWVLRIPGRTR